MYGRVPKTQGLPSPPTPRTQIGVPLHVELALYGRAPKTQGGFCGCFGGGPDVEEDDDVPPASRAQSRSTAANYEGGGS